MSQSKKLLSGETGLPCHYPIPKGSRVMFYIQRNGNSNTIVYELNLDQSGNLFESNPLKVYWKRYSEGGMVKKLNVIQEKLAFGYNSIKKRDGYFEFTLVAYPEKILFLRKTEKGYRVFTHINKMWANLDHIYVFAEGLGVFPKVKFAEMYGSELKYSLPVYEKINFNL